MSDEQTLRSYIKNMILETKKKQKKEYLESLTEERHLRHFIRQLLTEVEDDTPETTTGMNVLKDLLTVIVPILEDEYVQLSTSKDQRDSFRAHIIKSVQNLISTASMYTKRSEGSADLRGAAQPNPQQLSEADVDGDGVEDEEQPEGPQSDPAFINVKEPQQKKPEEAFVQIPNIDATGRDMAKKAFLRIQKQILESYSVLHDSKDRNLFYKYLITNLKLHFDSFEDSLTINPKEPTTPEYEEERSRKETESGLGDVGGESELGGEVGEQQPPEELETEL